LFLSCVSSQSAVSHHRAVNAANAVLLLPFPSSALLLPALMVQASSRGRVLVLSVLNQHNEAVPESCFFFREAMTSLHLLAGFMFPAA